MKQRTINYIRPKLYPLQQRAIFEPLDLYGNPARFSWIEASTKAGKAQPLDAVIYTPSGPAMMGDMAIGRRVLTPEGVSTVCGVYPQGERPVYKFTFSDRTVVEADESHLWEVHCYNRQIEVLTTKQLMALPKWRLTSSWVPLLERAAWFSTQSVSIDPYLVGVLIGDGSLKYEAVGFSSKDQQIIDAIKAALPDQHYLRKEPGPNYDWLITAGTKNAPVLREQGKHIRTLLARMGLIGKGSHEKFIPAEYKYNAVQVRTSILQGILDTDGWVDRNGQPCLDQTSKRLAEDVIELVQSLGGSVLTTVKSAGYKKDGKYIPCRDVYSQRIRMADVSQCFRLDRKHRLTKVRKKSVARHFSTIEFIGYKPTQCIEITDLRHLYLTNGFIPTHNTVGCIAWIYEQAFRFGGLNKNWWWVAPVFGQTEIAYRRLKAFLPKEQYDSNEGKLWIMLPNGGRIWFKSSDNPDSLFGEDVYGAVVDEASRTKQETLDALVSVLTATNGDARIIGNVKGKKNWFYKGARRAEMGWAKNAYYKITAADAVAAGVLKAEVIEEAQDTLSENVFNQLYNAEAADDGGNPFGLQYIQKIKVPVPNHKRVNCWGVDLAKGKNKNGDWTVATGLDSTGKVAEMHRWQGPWEATINRLEQLIGTLTPALVDSTGVGDPIVERLQKFSSNIEGYNFTAPSKQKLMEGLAVAVQKEETSVIEGVHEQEMESFEFEYTKTGVRYSAPEGYHDDTVCSHALAVMARKQGPDLSVWERLV